VSALKLTFSGKNADFFGGNQSSLIFAPLQSLLAFSHWLLAKSGEVLHENENSPP
jgi:hypothetical protein